MMQTENEKTIAERGADRLTFTADSAGPERLAQLKAFLQAEDAEQERLHRGGAGGRLVAESRTMAIDTIIAKLFQVALDRVDRAIDGLAFPVCLTALGGYGRAEMCPHSDVDLMFLYPRRAKGKAFENEQNHLIEDVLYPLWDLGLKVGHSSRTIRACLEEAAEDDQTKNALLEARFLCGNRVVWEDFESAYAKFIRNGDHRSYVKTRLEDQAARREKYGGTVFLQEPDIKNGVGGLRDYQNILWMAKVRLGQGRLRALEGRGFLSALEAERLRGAYDFLMRVRNELHFSKTRPTDLLDIESQPEVALGLGFDNPDLFRRVEDFMRVYYEKAHLIFTNSKLLEERLAMQELTAERRITFRSVIQSRRVDRQRYLDGFVVTDGVITFEQRNIFTENPFRLIRVFRMAQQQNAELDLDLRMLISDSVGLITPSVRHDEAANRCFRSILQEKGQVYPAIAQMHELGVLGQFLPEFGALTYLVQHEFYHRYTSDQHVMNCLRELDGIFSASDGMRKIYRDALQPVRLPGLLYPMLLLHQIGKAQDPDNFARAGAEMAENVLRRLGLSVNHRRTICRIIEIQEEMARFWQRFDLDDPQTSESFAHLVGDPETLRYLFVFTYCDARGTSANLWNDYKQALNEHLLEQSLENLQEDALVIEKRREERKMALMQEILEQPLPDIPEDQVEAHFNLLPERYFIHNSVEEVRLHLQMVHELLHTIAESDSIGSLVPVISWEDDREQGFSVVNVVTWDRAGLFFKLAGALTIAGVNILSTKAISRSDHITIDTFYVVDGDGGPVSNPRAPQIFRETLEAALLHNKDLMPEIVMQAKRVSKQDRYRSAKRLCAPIPPQVDIYHELSLRRTIVEVQTTDHVGLLYQLAQAMHLHGFDITFARVSTERDAAIDTFYIEPLNPNQGDSTGRLISLREALTAIVSTEELAAAVG